MMMPVLVVLAVLLVSLHDPAAAADYYVHNAVAESGNGTIGSPFMTIQEALNVAVAGDTVQVRGGTYSSATLSLRDNGTSAQPITLKALPGETVIITGTSGARLTINKNYWVFDGLIIDQNQLAQDAVQITATGITIRRSEIRNGQRDGISIGTSASSLTIEDSVIHDFMWLNPRTDAHCIVVDSNPGPSDIVIQGNTIQRCSGDGIQIFGKTGNPIAGYAKQVYILNNAFIDGTAERSGQTENAIDIKALDGGVIKGNTISGYTNLQSIVIQKGSRNIVIEDNLIRNGFTGIDLHVEGGAAFRQLNNTIRRNVIYNMKNYGRSTTYGIKADGLENITIINNTIANSQGRPFRFDATITPGVLGGMIQNNLTYNLPRSSSGTSNLSGVVVSHNGWFGAASGAMANPTDRTGTDPLFVDSVNGNYHLQEGSAAIDAGIPVGLSFHGGAPDLGAFERGGDGMPQAAPPGRSIR